MCRWWYSLITSMGADRSRRGSLRCSPRKGGQRRGGREGWAVVWAMIFEAAAAARRAAELRNGRSGRVRAWDPAAARSPQWPGQTRCMSGRQPQGAATAWNGPTHGRAGGWRPSPPLYPFGWAALCRSLVAQPLCDKPPHGARLAVALIGTTAGPVVSCLRHEGECEAEGAGMGRRRGPLTLCGSMSDTVCGWQCAVRPLPFFDCATSASPLPLLFRFPIRSASLAATHQTRPPQPPTCG